LLDTEVQQAQLDREGTAERRTLPWSLKSALIVSFAYANLCFYSAWQQLESRYYDFFLSPVVRLDVALLYFLALLADIALLTLLLWGAYVWISRSSIPHAARIVAITFLILLVVPLNLLRTELGSFSLENRAAVAALIVVGIVALLSHNVVIRPLGILLMLSWPLLFVQIISSATHVISAARYTEPALAKRFSGVPAKRLLWVVFDEFDEGLAFEGRHPGLPLPNLDALKGESLAANNVHRSQRATPLAIPSLVLEKIVSRETIAGPTGLRLTFTDGTSQSHPFNDSIFSIVRGRGVNAAVSGWYLPYCRLFNDSLTDCVWSPGESQLESISTSLDPPVIKGFLDTMLMFPLNVLGRLPGTDRLGLTWAPIGFATSRTRAAHQILELQKIHQAAMRFSTDPGLGLVYVHYPIPHLYAIYNSLASRVEPGGNYWDNLQLVDKTLGELRTAMEKAHLWDSTAVLVSSDHSLRHDEDPLRGARDPGAAVEFVPPGAEGQLVPFMLKLPSQKTGIRYEAPFNAVLTRDLLLSVLSGEVSSPEQSVQWLDSNRTRVPVLGK
jgi:hypothetical protein